MSKAKKQLFLQNFLFAEIRAKLLSVEKDELDKKVLTFSLVHTGK